MPYTLAILDVDDYDRWKAAFDASDSARRAVGEGAYQVLQSEDDPNQVVVLVEWDDLDRAKEAMVHIDLQKKMMEAGVHMPPQILFLNEADSGTVSIAQGQVLGAVGIEWRDDRNVE